MLWLNCLIALLMMQSSKWWVDDLVLVMDGVIGRIIIAVDLLLLVDQWQVRGMTTGVNQNKRRGGSRGWHWTCMTEITLLYQRRVVWGWRRRRSRRMNERHWINGCWRRYRVRERVRERPWWYWWSRSWSWSWWRGSHLRKLLMLSRCRRWRRRWYHL